MIQIEVSPGELVDKITILEIKNRRIDDADKLKNVRRELEALNRAWQAAVPVPGEQIESLTRELTAVNETLWDIEDDIRRCEARSDFGQEFIRLARAVYRTNDERARLKRRVNELLGSELVEEKDYQTY